MRIFRKPGGFVDSTKYVLCEDGNNLLIDREGKITPSSIDLTQALGYAVTGSWAEIYDPREIQTILRQHNLGPAVRETSPVLGKDQKMSFDIEKALKEGCAYGDTECDLIATHGETAWLRWRSGARLYFISPLSELRNLPPKTPKPSEPQSVTFGWDDAGNVSVCVRKELMTYKYPNYATVPTYTTKSGKQVSLDCEWEDRLVSRSCCVEYDFRNECWNARLDRFNINPLKTKAAALCELAAYADEQGWM